MRLWLVKHTSRCGRICIAGGVMETCKEGEQKACVLSLIKNHEHQPISTSLFLYSSVIHHILLSSIHTDVTPKHNSANKFLLQNHGQAQKASTMQCRISYLSHCATKQMIKKHIKNLPKYICTDFKNLQIPPASNPSIWSLSSKNITQTHGIPWEPSCETSKPAPLPV